MKFLVVNIETSGADHVSVEKNLNNLGALGWEHYDQEKILAYMRHTDGSWEYRCVTIYGTSATQTDAINALTSDGWEHYKQIGSRGYFKRVVRPAVAEVPVAAEARHGSIAVAKKRRI